MGGAIHEWKSTRAIYFRYTNLHIYFLFFFLWSVAFTRMRVCAFPPLFFVFCIPLHQRSEIGSASTAASTNRKGRANGKWLVSAVCAATPQLWQASAKVLARLLVLCLSHRVNFLWRIWCRLLDAPFKEQQSGVTYMYGAAATEVFAAHQSALHDLFQSGFSRKHTFSISAVWLLSSSPLSFIRSHISTLRFSVSLF